MLESLTIKNIALIDNLTIELGKGLNVLTGETGAGKSLIIDSLALLLGEKADRGLISYGENFASVEAVFETKNAEVMDKLEEFGLDRENTIVIFRKLSIDGKNECRVNGKSFSLSMLKAITSPLMDLHGQFGHQELLKQSVQLKTLDAYGGTKIKDIKDKYSEIYHKYKSVKKELSKFNFDSRDREKLIDLYAYQINEIEEAHFVSGEEETLKEFRVRVLNQEKIMMTIERLKNLFSGAGETLGLSELISKCDREFVDIVKYIPEQEETAKRISSVRFELDDIEETIDSLSRNLDFDEYSAEQNEKRLDLLFSLKKKYGDSIDEINSYLAKIKAEYDKLVNSAEIMESLEKQKNELEKELIEVSEQLTTARKQTAEVFESVIQNELSELSMKGAKFVIKFERNNVELCDETGFDNIEYLFTANAGQPAKPLSKVASGGEISRFMLAVKNVTANLDNIDTMIFDEIDTGISGDAANALAEKLTKIGKGHQVMCVTHLAQVASFGSTHYFISKAEENGKTKTSLKLLGDDDRITEIARLIGGNISEFSKSHAKLMLDAGKNFNS